MSNCSINCKVLQNKKYYDHYHLCYFNSTLADTQIYMHYSDSGVSQKPTPPPTHIYIGGGARTRRTQKGNFKFLNEHYIYLNVL